MHPDSLDQIGIGRKLQNSAKKKAGDSESPARIVIVLVSK
jgi:hypothetical protein